MALQGYMKSEGFLGTGGFTWTEKGAEMVNKGLLGTGEEEAKKLLDMEQEVKKEYEDILNDIDVKTTNDVKINVKVQYDEGELGQLQQKLAELRQEQQHAIDNAEFNVIQKDIDAVQKQIDAITGKTDKKATNDITPLQDAQKKITELTNEALTADEERREAIRLEIEDLQKQVAEYKKIQDYVQGIKKDEDKPAKETKPKEEKLLNYSQEGIANLGSQIKSAMSKSEIGSADYKLAADQLLDFTTFENLLKAATERGIQPDPEWMASLFEDIKVGADVDEETWQAVVDHINELIEGTEFPSIDLDVKTGKVEAASEAAVSNAKDTASAWQNAVAAVNNVGSALQQIEDPAAKVSGIVMQAVANIALGFAQAAASPATGAAGVFGWIAAATAGVATMVSTIAAIKSATSGSYASGGIIPGNSFSGDNLTANVNSGELILNRAQQGAIAGQLEGNPMGNMQLETRISGTDMLIFLNNTNRSLGGSRSFYSERH